MTTTTVTYPANTPFPESLVRDGNTDAVGWKYYNMTAANTFIIKGGPGVLGSIMINHSGSNDTLTIYDNASAASGTKIGTITVTTGVNFMFTYNAAFTNGLVIVAAGTAGDYTVTFV